MDYIEILTDYLTLMANNNDKNLRTEHWKPVFKMNTTDDVTEILEKFVRDGFVIKSQKDNWYQISVDGRLFVEYGAYRQRKADEDLDRDYKARRIQEVRNNEIRQLKILASQVRQMALLNRLTWAVAGATTIAACYYLIEIIKNLAPACAGR